MLNLPHISVCICTYKRPILLRHLLKELERQETDGVFSFSVVIVDNDRLESARQIVEDFAITSSLETLYCTEPQQNIALARNRAVSSAKGDFIAFIDDDEFPTTRWLRNLLATCGSNEVAGALGPVKPYFSSSPPSWITKGKILERPSYETGHMMDWRTSRTGNLLFKKEIVEKHKQPFRSEFGTGGEDVDFFERMMKMGHKFVWCDEADVFEEVPPERWNPFYQLRRGLLRGKNSLRREGFNLISLGRSMIALVLYAVMLPFLLIGGQHYFMKYAIKFCDHAGKILAAIHLNPINER
jgi:glycosyltransferase involved in cell wall biosynthesis